MVVKIIHAADNHIGLSFARYPSDIRERLVAGKGFDYYLEAAKNVKKEVTTAVRFIWGWSCQ